MTHPLPPASSLLAVRIRYGALVSNRLARVDYADSHSDALCLVGADGREIVGELVSYREMTDDEADEFLGDGVRPCTDAPSWCWPASPWFSRRAPLASCAAIETVGEEVRAA